MLVMISWALGAVMLPSSIGGGQIAPAWCFAERPAVEHVEAEGAEVTPLSSGRMAAALAALRERTLVELTPAEVTDLLGSEAAGGNGRYYLVRAAVFAPAGTTIGGVEDVVRNSFFRLLFDRREGTVVVMSLTQAKGVPTEASNAAVIVRSPFALNHAYTACYSAG